MPERPSSRTRMIVGIAAGVVIGASYLGWSAVRPKAEAPAQITLGELERRLEAGEIKAAEFAFETIAVETTDGREHVLAHAGWLYRNGDLSTRMVEADVAVTFPVSSVTGAEMFGRFLSTMVSLSIVLLVLGAFLYFRKTIFAPSWPKVSSAGSVRMKDVAGQDEAKAEIAEVADFLTAPEEFAVVGARAPKGVILTGPPGTGKTLLAKALAGEAGANFIAVSGSDFSNMFVGVGRSKVSKLFRMARKQAPCIVFVDEIDALGRKRGTGTGDAGREYDTTLNQFLVEMDGFEESSGVVVVAATNMIDSLDPALLRPGRLDRRIEVSLPDVKGRLDILRVHMVDRPINTDVSLETVAKGSPGFSGADLANLVNEAAINCGRRRGRLITMVDFEHARDRVAMGLERTSAVMDEQTRRIVAVHEAGHALVACKSEHSDAVHKATIIPRGGALGLVMRIPERDMKLVSRAKLLADLDVAMAGRAAEIEVFGDDMVTAGAIGDIEYATRIAAQMVLEAGLGVGGGMLSASTLPEWVRDRSSIDEIRTLTNEAMDRALKTVQSHRGALDALTAELLERETLTGLEVRDIIERAAGLGELPEAA